MAKPKAPSEPAEPAGVECAAPECAVRFTPERSTAKYHSATCRQRAARARKAAQAAAEADEKAKGADAEHGLVTATRLELEKHLVLETVDGQIALQLARKLTDPDHVSPGLAKELRASIAAAKDGAAATPTPSLTAVPNPRAEDDKVTKLRETRERKAREAAGRA